MQARVVDDEYGNLTIKPLDNCRRISKNGDLIWDGDEIGVPILFRGGKGAIMQNVGGELIIAVMPIRADEAYIKLLLDE